MDRQVSLTFLVFVMLLTVTGCDSTFEPIQPNDDIVFSMYGTLDLHADTQWVRIMPIGETLLPNEFTFSKAHVTLTRLETGETVTMNDSLFAFRNNTYVYNYWTEAALHPEEEYLLRAEAPDGRTSRARVSIPRSIPRPLTDYSTREEEGLVVIPTDEQLVVVESKFLVEEMSFFGPVQKVEVAFSHLDQLFLTENGHYRFRIEANPLIYNELQTGFRILDRKLVIASGSKEWPDLSDLTEEEIPIPGIYSNVENGTGVVAGIASREVPLKRCVDENEELIPCEEND